MLYIAKHDCMTNWRVGPFVKFIGAIMLHCRLCALSILVSSAHNMQVVGGRYRRIYSLVNCLNERCIDSPPQL